MLRNLIGKNVAVVINLYDNSPLKYEGRVMDVSDDIIKINVIDSNTPLYKKVHKGFTVKNIEYEMGICYINFKYVVSIFEITE